MKTLLLAIVDALQNNQIDVNSEDVSVVPDLSYIPKATADRAFCIKDGNEDVVELSGGAKEVTQYAYVVVWRKILEKAGTSVVGTDTEKGTLSLCETVKSVLCDNLLDIDGMNLAKCIKQRASELMGAKTTTLQRQVLEFKYIKETEGSCGS